MAWFDELINWLICLLIDWLVDWSIDCLIATQTVAQNENEMERALGHFCAHKTVAQLNI